MAMTWLVTTGLTNALVAALLAVAAYGLGRWLKRPALTHVLWVLVLIKLLTPPVFPVPVGWRIDPAIFGEGSTVATSVPLPAPAAPTIPTAVGEGVGEFTCPPDASQIDAACAASASAEIPRSIAPAAPPA